MPAMLLQVLFVAFFLGIGHTCPTDLQLEPCRCKEVDSFSKKPHKGLEISCKNTTVGQVRVVFENVLQTKRPVDVKLENTKLESLSPHLLHTDLYLESFTAEHCNLSSVDEYAFSAGIDTLWWINLNHNNLRSVPTSSLKKLRSLKFLYLNYNRIEVLHADSFKGIHSLMSLSLRGNRMKSIDDSAFQIGSAFLFIFLGENELTSVPSRALSKASVIKKLSLENNKISSLQLEEFSVTDGSSLEGLWLMNNSIRHIPPRAFSSLKSLETLVLSGNAIDSVDPLAFEGIGDTLDFLQLGENLLKEVPAVSLRKMRRLKYLYLEGNNISKIREDDFVPYGTTVKYLHLENNSLTFIDPKSLVSLNSLQDLVLRNNKLTTFPNETYAPVLNKLQRFDISGNPLHCDCQAAWLKDLTETRGTKCASPKEHENATLRNIPKNSLVCQKSTPKACDSGTTEMYSASNSLSVTSNDHMVTLNVGLTYFQRCFGDSEAGTSNCPSGRNPIVGGFIDLKHCGPGKMCLTIHKDGNSIS